jgi:uncharacterized membrane protein
MLSRRVCSRVSPPRASTCAKLSARLSVPQDELPPNSEEPAPESPGSSPAARPAAVQPPPGVIPLQTLFAQAGVPPYALPGGGAAFPAAMLLAAAQQTWTGPYPPPEAAERFEKLLPGSFNRILTMAEQTQAAQIRINEKAQGYLRDDTRRGHWLGWTSTVLAMIGAAVCALVHEPWVAGLFLSVPVLAVGQALVETTKAPKPTEALKSDARTVVPSGPPSPAAPASLSEPSPSVTPN